MSLRLEPSRQDEKLYAHLHRSGLKLTSNRCTVLDVFLACTEPVTVADLWLRAKKADPRTSHSTAWRLLTALVECGLASRAISPADGVLRYRPLKMECKHERLACQDCGIRIEPDTVTGIYPEGGPHEFVAQTEKE